MATGSASRKSSTAKADKLARAGAGSSKGKQERKEIAVNVRLQPEELKTIDALVARRLGRGCPRCLAFGHLGNLGSQPAFSR
jgi:hypothetical protein